MCSPPSCKKKSSAASISFSLTAESSSSVDATNTPLLSFTSVTSSSKISAAFTDSFFMHQPGENSTSKLEWKPSPGPFLFGSFKLADSSSSYNLKTKLGMDETDNLCCDLEAHSDSSAINCHRLEVPSGVPSVPIIVKSGNVFIVSKLCYISSAQVRARECFSFQYVRPFEQTHTHVGHLLFDEMFVKNSESKKEPQKVFDKISERTFISWNSVTIACVENLWLHNGMSEDLVLVVTHHKDDAKELIPSVLLSLSGDLECKDLMVWLEFDLAQVMLAACRGELSGVSLNWSPGSAKVVPPLELNKLFIIVVVLSMALTPFLNEARRRAASFIEDKSDVENKPKASGMVDFNASEPVVIPGFGQMAQVLANFLSNPLASRGDSDATGWPYVAFDPDPKVVKAARKLILPILYGDGSRPAVLQSAGIDYVHWEEEDN
ncbi:Regulator of K+ conductance, N-terminal [Sesbania bispinosa]|nr:Regulator of K+ conductance, N-terminal [Sesbania bispinosa]